MVLNEFHSPACEECGMSSINHDLERVSVAMDTLIGRLFRPFGFLLFFISPFFTWITNLLAPGIMDWLILHGYAVKVPDPDLTAPIETTIALWQEAKKRGIDFYEVRIFGLARNLFVARYKGRSVFFQSLPRTARWQPSILWMDDKAELKKRFRKAGFPVANGGLCFTRKQALKMFRKLEKPVIVKPNEGSAGRHTTVHINTEAELSHALDVARQVAPFVMIEEELKGPVFRITLIDRKIAGVLRRDPPRVIGDGVSTVAQLVDKENENPLREGPVFAKIDPHTKVSRAELERQGKTLESIPEKDEVVYFNFKVNWGVGGTSWDVTEDVHPDNNKLFMDIARYLKDDIVGIDFIISNISRSWKEEKRCGVIELNSLPQLGNHHFPYKGDIQNAAGAVWDMIFGRMRT